LATLKVVPKTEQRTIKIEYKDKYVSKLYVIHEFACERDFVQMNKNTKRKRPWNWASSLNSSIKTCQVKFPIQVTNEKNTILSAWKSVFYLKSISNW